MSTATISGRSNQAGKPGPKPGARHYRKGELKASRAEVLAAIERAGGDVTLAAANLGISKQTAYNRLNEGRPKLTNRSKPQNNSARPAKKRRGRSGPGQVPQPPRPRPVPQYSPPPPAGMPLDEIWRQFRANPTIGYRNAIAENYLGLVKYCALSIAHKMPESDEVFSDLHSAGVFGLLGAIEKFDLDRGLQFDTYAVPRIRGAMLDYLREQDWAPRLVRAKAKKVAAAVNELELRLGREPSSDELAEFLQVSGEELAEIIASSRCPKLLSMDKKLFSSESENRDYLQSDVLQDSKAIPPSSRLRSKDFLRRVLRGLNQNERLLMILYYWEGEVMSEIGRQLQLSESRVSQMHKQIVERLKEQWSGAKAELVEMLGMELRSA